MPVPDVTLGGGAKSFRQTAKAGDYAGENPGRAGSGTAVIWL